MTATQVTTSRHARGRRPGDTWRTVARTTGELLITLGLVLLLFVAYELWGTGLYTSKQQGVLSEELHKFWARDEGPDVWKLDRIPIGDGVAVLRVPRFGRDYRQIVVEGTGYEDLKRGPGHYPGTAMPGQVGNFAVAGHRTTYGAPFGSLDSLRPGDAIVLETRDRWFTYRVGPVQDVDGYPQVPYQEIVDPSEVDVAFAVPDQPDEAAEASLRLLTFTSCHPKYSAAQRIVVHARLTETLRKAQGIIPEALTEQRRG